MFGIKERKESIQFSGK